MSFIINPYNFAAAGSTTLLSEDFEGPGATGWTSTVPWSDQFSTSPAPLNGDYSGNINGTTTTIHAYKSFTASNNVYCRFSYLATRNTSGNGALATIRDASGNVLATFGIVSGTNVARATPAGGSTVNASTAPTSNIFYYGWFEYEKGTGSNAVCRVGFRDDSQNRPSWPTSGASGRLAVSINGTSTATPARIMFGSSTAATNYNIIFDDIEVRDTPFA
jgi:hypothetical protein